MLTQYATLFPENYQRYFEPFVGGGAVFFCLNPRISFLADVNTELINTYTVVRDSVEELIASLKNHVNEKEYYYFVRGQFPNQLSNIERASRFIYLNKTCYNGLYRVNKAGIFNVPFGKYKNPKIADESSLRAANYCLQSVRLTATSFEEATKEAAEGDFVYLDPPYHPLNETSKFTNYAENGFTTIDQRKLLKHYRELDSRGCLLMLSNSDTPLIRDLYSDFDIREVNAKRMINCQSNKRGEIKELVIRNYIR
jgi:DNA adenine methylase